MTRARSSYTADYVAVAYTLAYYGWLALRTPRQPSSLLIAELSFYPLGLAVGWQYLRNAGVGSLDRRTRLGWASLSVSALILWFVGNTWPALVSDFGASTPPAWAGTLETVRFVFLLFGLLVFPWRPPAWRRTGPQLADVGLVLVAGFVLAHHYGFRAAGRVLPSHLPEAALAQAVLDWLVFVTIAVGILQKRDATTRGVFLWLLLSYTLYQLADYRLAGLHDYRVGDSVDGIWFAAWVCRWAGARFAWHRYQREQDADATRDETPVTERRGGMFSYTLVAVIFAVLIGRVTMAEREHLEMFVLSATAMAGLLLLRQAVQIRENRHLYGEQLAQEARFRSLVQKATDIVLIVEAGGRVTYASPSTDRVFGPGAILPGARLADLLPKEDADALAPPATDPSRPVVRRQCRLRTARGDSRAVEIASTDLRDDPAVRGIVLNCRDVTERDELDRQLRQALQLDAVGHLAGGLAHDFNNVLMVIRGYAQLLRDDFPALSQKSADLRTIEDAVDRAAAVTKKLVAFSRDRAVERTELDLNLVLRDLMPLLRQLLPDRIEVDIDAADDLWTVRADQGQIEQVIVNLVDNARDAMPGGGRVRIRTANRPVADGTPATADLPAGDYVALAVSDQGVGLPDQPQQRMFEPFLSTKPKDQGLGLGLAMIRSIVSGCGGGIVVDSAADHDTTCTVLLPRSTDPAGVTERPSTGSVAPGAER